MKIVVSFSGGRTSAKMAYLLKKNWSDSHELFFVIANTSKERRETLDFADRCDKEWGLGLVWLEAVVHDERKGCTSRVVDYATACRDGEVFEKVIQKYGIPNMNYLHCTRELKANPIKHYVEEVLGWSDYVIAQGMRIDEPKRIKPKKNVIYPLAHTWPTTKPEVLDWWKEQPFDLGLKDHQGNCDACHKKNILKLVRIAQEDEHVFDWWGKMEQEYGLAGYNEDGTKRVFFRGQRSAQDVVAMSKLLVLPPLPDDEEPEGCAESCEAF